MSNASSPTPHNDSAVADRGWALSPLDSRYRAQTYQLTEYLSEDAINRLRLHIEVEWLVFISEHALVPGLPALSEDEVAYLRDLPADYNEERRARLGEFEAETRHDVKAVEYLVREHIAGYGDSTSDGGGSSALNRYQEAVHLLCTSEDINNLAVALGTRGAIEEVWLPSARSLVATISAMARALAEVPMLARTHGQSATPTTVGKELAVFGWRLSHAIRRIEGAEYLGKFNGATGTYSAHTVVLPGLDWFEISRLFVEGLGLTWNPITTQIESHDWQGYLYSDLAAFNRIAHNLATDMWTYISLGYFRQELAAQGSTGSSTMPHKINPIRFENAESNLELSNALLNTFAEVLSTSRMQRDLSDSSTQRNIGVGLGYSLVAFDNLVRGLKGLTANAELLEDELTEHWEVISEAIQQALRIAELGADEDAHAAAYAPGEGPYELLKAATRGRTVTREAMAEVIQGADLPEDLRTRLLTLSPRSYTGLAPQIVSFLD
ncbi:adenylosuccinate lyase [Actinomyces minihominis]|uniref:adenylosuccinate lyase n=1 Tax=Actinomyces minihominis TaxID=2002838 RepID=UPI000C0759AA|nr:adenylosuccinate lyase [Actinomyces minihominis]